jgi:hypothetical protein
MEPETILVLALSAGVVALLVWLEINSRRNDANQKQTSSLAQLGSGLRKDTQSEAESDLEKTKAA